MSAITYRIPDQNLGRLQAEIEKLNRRCRRLKIQEITIEVGEHVDVEVNVEHFDNGYSGKTLVQRYHTVVVEGETPCYNGWTLAAVISTTEEGNILRTSPIVNPDSLKLIDYRHCKPECEHCNTNPGPR